MKLEVDHEGSGMTLATAPHLVVCVWTGPPTLDHIRHFTETNQRMRERYPEGAALINVVLRGKPKFTGPVTKAASDALADLAPWRSATAHVIMVEGFTGAAVRSFLSTLSLVSRAKRPVKTFGDVKSAASWLTQTLANHPALSWNEAALVSALSDLTAFS